jgi:hypothetical protein
MSSATSIKKVLQAEDSGAQAEDSSFRPWHFFVLASLMAATAAVVLARQSTPANLVLISLTIGAAGVAAAGFYRMLAPLGVDEETLFSETLTERQRAALDREKTLVLRSIKELEFDRAMGKLSEKDFEEMSGRLRARALSLMKELDAGGSGYRELIERELNARVGSVRLKPDATGSVRADADENPVTGSVRLQPDQDTVGATPTCTCGTANDQDAVFCKRCGTRLGS